MEYPPSFSAELVRHCQLGCIPPEVFVDAQTLLSDDNRLRYVRVNPRSQARVCASGAGRALHLQKASVAETNITEEQQAICHLQTFLTFTSTTTEDDVVASVPAAPLLRLGVSALTGLPLSQVAPVPWLPGGVFALPWSFAIGSADLFKDGTLLAMDAASVAAVVALRPRRGDRVLDLCCAPGMKLGLVADAVGEVQENDREDDTSQQEKGETVEPPRGLAVGVDINLNRLYVSRSTLRKQTFSDNGLSSLASLPVCLFQADGCWFHMGAALRALDAGPATVTVDRVTGLTAREHRLLSQAQRTQKKKRSRSADVSNSNKMESSVSTRVVYAPAAARASLRAWRDAASREGQPSSEAARREVDAADPVEMQFERVLVDAECSHDGSVAHLHMGSREASDSVHNVEDNVVRTSESAAPAIEKGRGLTNEYRMHRLHLGDNDTTSSAAKSPSSSSLFELQSELLYNGYQLLKPGGTLVYSTCSYAFTQDELVVRRFLDRVNGAAEAEKQSVKVTAVLVPAFSYEHENEGSGMAPCHSTSVAPCVSLKDEETATSLQHKLDAHSADYGIVAEGMQRYFPVEGNTAEAAPSLPVGSRFWPRTFACSFLYVAKIWKRVDAN